MSDWISTKDKLPEKDGEYLCTIKINWLKDEFYLKLCDFYSDLYRVDDFDFYEYKGQHKSGFYDFDYEYGYCAIDNVVAWQSLPKPYQEEV